MSEMATEQDRLIVRLVGDEYRYSFRGEEIYSRKVDEREEGVTAIREIRSRAGCYLVEAKRIWDCREHQLAHELEKSARSPAPWRVDGAGKSAMVRDSELRIVAVRHRLDGDANEANMRLMAAAPDLLEALRPFAEFAEAADRRRHSDGSTCEYRLKAGDLRRARSAIAKAEGRE